MKVKQILPTLKLCTIHVIGSFSTQQGRRRQRERKKKDNRFIEQNNKFPRSSCFFVHFFAAHTHTNKEGAKTRGRAERRQRAVRFTRFLDYRLMFDLGRSFSLKNDLIRPPY